MKKYNERRVRRLRDVRDHVRGMKGSYDDKLVYVLRQVYWYNDMEGRLFLDELCDMVEFND